MPTGQTVTKCKTYKENRILVRLKIVEGYGSFADSKWNVKKINKLFVFVVNLDTFYDCKVNFKESNVVETLIYLFCINFDLKQFVVFLYNNC